MAEVLTAECIDPSKLTEPQRKALSEQLYQIHKEVFIGLDEQTFDHYVVNSPAIASKITLYRNTQRELVGYFGVHRFEKQLEEQSVVIFRAEVGLLPSCRHKDANLACWMTEAAKYKLLHPNKAVYFFYVPVSPSFYAMIARCSHCLYPQYHLSVPASELHLMTQLAEQFALPQADCSNSLIREVGWITKSSYREKQFWESSSNPHIRFYCDANPKYGDGTGLLTLIPMTLTNTLISLFGIWFYVLKKRFRKHLAGGLVNISELVESAGCLKSVEQFSFPELPGKLVCIVLHFENLSCTINVNEETDEIVMSQNEDISGLVEREKSALWRSVLGEGLSWVWELTNQQGYSDGLRLEFSESWQIIELVVIAFSIKEYKVSLAE